MVKLEGRQKGVVQKDCRPIVVEDDADEKIAGDAETDATDALDAEDDEVSTEPPSNDDVE